MNPPIITGTDLEAAPNFAFANWETDVASIGCVEWGLTPAYGEEACEPVERFEHRVLLSGLEPGQTYHYRIRSLGPEGESFTENFTFTTLAAQPVLSDDFHFDNLLRPQWRLEDPGAQGQLQSINSAAEGGVRLLTPAGADYAVDGTARSLRLLQPSLGGNFVSETKIYSALDAEGESTGVVYHYDSKNFLRFGFEYLNGEVVLRGVLTKIDDPVDFASTSVIFGEWDGVDPLYLRVNHTDDMWFADWSFDGQAWMPGIEIQHPLPSNEGGLYVSSASGSNEGHSGLFDYYFDDAYRIVPEDETIRTDRTAPFIYRIEPTATSTSEIEVTWYTDESTTGGMDWGETEELEAGRLTADVSAFVHSLVIDQLFPGTPYFVRGFAVDAAGNEAVANSLNHSTESE